MPRGPSSNPIVKRIPWQQRPTCAECGLKIRRPRPGDEKVCSRCHELLHVRSSLTTRLGRIIARRTADRARE